MDNVAAFGPVIHKLTFGEAIERELLTDYQVVIVGVDEPTVREWIKDEEIVSTAPDSQTDARTLAAKIGLIKAIKDYDLQRVISFHSRVSRAKEFSDEFSDVVHLIEEDHRPSGRFLSDYVSGEMKAGDRKGKIDLLKQLDGFERGILTNARCLAEGVDVPSLDGVAFIDPRGSQIEIIQAVGRAIRKVRGASVQKKGTIVIPVFIEDGDDPKDAIEASNFKPVWDVLKALRSHDEVLAEALDHYRRSMAKGAVRNDEWNDDKIIFDLPTSVGAEFSASLRTVLVEATTASWEFWFGLLEKFKEREGHCRVPYDFEQDGFGLGAWVSRQRASKNIMQPERMDRLSDFGFVWDILAELWEEGFEHLLIFKKREGHCRVPKGHIEQGYNLYNWTSVQRRYESIMDQRRMARLNEIGFSWDVTADFWEDAYKILLKYFSEHGHTKVSARSEYEGFKLGNWVSNQRTRRNQLSSLQLDKLNRVNFIWSPFDQAFEQGIENLKSYIEKFGHADPSARDLIGDFKIGSWATVVRGSREKLSSERVALLNSLGFKWSRRQSDWDSKYSLLAEYVREFGHCNIESKAEFKGVKLGAWLNNQRFRLKSNSDQDYLLKERMELLAELGVKFG